MRAGPLSDDKIIKILNRYFVPFYASYEDYERATGAVSKEESDVFNNVIKNFRDAKISGGLVFVYIFTGDLVPLGNLHVTKASNPDTLETFLSGFISRLQITGGQPAFQPRPQSMPPPASKDSLVVHVFIRGFTVEQKFPHEDWIVLSSEEVRRLLPVSQHPGESWLLDSEVAAKFSQRLHPTLAWSLTGDHGYTTRIDHLNIRAVEQSSSGEFRVAKLEGKLQMLRTAYSFAPDKSHVRANLSGYMTFDGSTVHSLEIAVQDAFYGNGSADDKEFEGYVEGMPGAGSRQLKERMTSAK